MRFFCSIPPSSPVPSPQTIQLRMEGGTPWQTGNLCCPRLVHPLLYANRVKFWKCSSPLSCFIGSILWDVSTTKYVTCSSQNITAQKTLRSPYWGSLDLRLLEYKLSCFHAIWDTEYLKSYSPLQFQHHHKWLRGTTDNLNYRNGLFVWVIRTRILKERSKQDVVTS